MADGIITDIYGAETLSGQWACSVNGAISSEVFDADMEVPPLNVSIYTIGEEKYYMYDLSYCSDDQIALCETYINRCRDEAGINWVSDEEVEEAIRKRCSSIGVNYGTIGQQEEAGWTNIVD